MSCAYFSERLMAYLEHETDDPTRAALERHALSCAECGALLADLRSLRIEASNLPELTPSRDLWSGIAARIEAPVVSIGTVRHVEQNRSRVIRRWTRGALIAASLVGAAGIGYVAANRRAVAIPDVYVAQQPPETVYQIPSAAQDSAVRVAQRPVQEVEKAAPRVAAAQSPTTRAVAGTPADIVVARLTSDYDREIARLRVLVEQRRNQMDPITVAIIEKNLQVIDTAITECKKAIVRDPSSRFLIESLNQSLQTKVELMRTVALLPSRI
jgi:anti-sigma factor RsiW